jgi:hypothetical protein
VHRCSNCKHCEHVTDRWEQGQIIGSYNTCKIDNSVITDEEQINNCSDWKLKRVKPFDFTLKLENIECPF